MNFRNWNIDLTSKTARHASGFHIVVEGDPSEPSGIMPKHFPRQLNAADQAKLLRIGLHVMMTEARRGGHVDAAA